MFVGVADDLGYARQGGDFFWGALGVASGDDDLAVGILTVDAADGSSGIVVGGSSDRASIQDDDFGAGGASVTLEAALLELALDGGAIGLGGAASEILDIESCHGSSVT